MLLKCWKVYLPIFEAEGRRVNSLAENGWILEAFRIVPKVMIRNIVFKHYSGVFQNVKLNSSLCVN